MCGIVDYACDCAGSCASVVAMFVKTFLHVYLPVPVLMSCMFDSYATMWHVNTDCMLSEHFSSAFVDTMQKLCFCGHLRGVAFPILPLYHRQQCHCKSWIFAGLAFYITSVSGCLVEAS